MTNIEFQPSTRQVAALMSAGYRLYEQGRMRDAKRIFEGLTVLDTKNAYAHGLLGTIYQKEQNYDAALSRYTIAISLFPRDPNLFTNRGEIYLKLGKLEEAAADLKKSIELDASQKNPAANRARILVRAVQDSLRIPSHKQ